MQFLFFLPDFTVRGRIPGICVASFFLFSDCFGELVLPLFGEGSFSDFSGERGLVWARAFLMELEGLSSGLLFILLSSIIVKVSWSSIGLLR